MTYFDKFVIQGLSKYCKENYHDLKYFFKYFFKNLKNI